MDLNIPDLDERTLQSVMKVGGKKKLDGLIDILDGSGPIRLQDLKDAKTLADAKTAAKALKNSAGNLGLAQVEDLCDQILECASWPSKAGLLAKVDQALERGRKALRAYRGGI